VKSNGRRSGATLIALAVGGGLAFATLFAFAVAGVHGGKTAQNPVRPTGIPASVSTALADQMQLSPVPRSAAPGFTLTDQAGRTVSLTSFKGRTVVLTFMDSHCTDVCPIVSREFIDAKNDLGTTASRVVFVAVNVNPFHLRVADVAAFSREQQLDSIGSWYFLTGSVPSLRAVWRAYGVAVIARNPRADVIHTSVVYFIDPAGQERFVAAPYDDHTRSGAAFLPAGQLASWGLGIALVARSIS
jgi:protein SCO1/2